MRRVSHLRCGAGSLRKYEKPVTDGRCIFGIGFTVERVLVHRSPWAQCSRVVVMTYKSIRAMFDKGNPVGIKAMSSPVGIFTKMKEMFACDCPEF